MISNQKTVVNKNTRRGHAVVPTQEATIVPISQGGTGGSTAEEALANILPDQTDSANKFLYTDGETAYWVSLEEILESSGYVPGGSVSHNYSVIIGDNINNTFTITHNLDSTTVKIAVYLRSDGSEVYCNKRIVTSNIVELVFNNVIDELCMTCVVIG